MVNILQIEKARARSDFEELQSRVISRDLESRDEKADNSGFGEAEHLIVA